MDIVQMTEVMGNVGEFVGSFAVLATLIYLSLQVRHSKALMEENRKIALSQVYQARAALTVGMASQGIDSPNQQKLAMKYFGAPDEESARERSFHIRLMTAADNVLFQYELGLIDDTLIGGTRNLVVQQYPNWIESGINVTPRVESCYEAFK